GLKECGDGNPGLSLALQPRAAIRDALRRINDIKRYEFDLSKVMTPERWQQIKDVFNLALEYAPAERRAFVSQACEEDVDLQKEVESLLAAHEKDGSFIDSPAYKAASEWIVDEQPAELKPGQILNSYEIT